MSDWEGQLVTTWLYLLHQHNLGVNVAMGSTVGISAALSMAVIPHADDPRDDAEDRRSYAYGNKRHAEHACKATGSQVIAVHTGDCWNVPYETFMQSA